jgi:hypothetical protein
MSHVHLLTNQLHAQADGACVRGQVNLPAGLTVDLLQVHRLIPKKQLDPRIRTQGLPADPHLT